MVSEEFILQKMQEANDGGRAKTFAEFIASIFVGRFVEIYLSDSYEEVSVEQISTNYPAVFCGKVVGAYRECLVINAAYVDKSRKLQLGNMMFISERAIKALNAVDGNGTFEEMFLRSKESLDVKAAFVDHIT
jgi:hypothetical protein